MQWQQEALLASFCWNSTGRDSLGWRKVEIEGTKEGVNIGVEECTTDIEELMFR